VQRTVSTVLFAAVAATMAPAQPPVPVATVDGIAITYQDLERKVGDRDLKARIEEYNTRGLALSALIDSAVLSDEARKRGTTVKELLAAIDAKVQLPTIDDARVAYEATHPNIKAAPSDEELHRQLDFLKLQRVGNARGAYIDELRRQRKIEIFLEPPRASRSLEKTGPSRGSADAPVTIVEFLDFQCPYCADVQRTLAQLSSTYGEKLRFVFRNHPMPMHRNAQAAAEAAMCADRQGRFWEMHDKLFASQSALGNDDLIKYAGELGLDLSAFRRCFDGHETAPVIEKDTQDAWGLDLRAAPAFLVNGQLLTGAAPPSQFAQIIDEELKRAAKGAASNH